jgi:hypothetical protein
MKSLNRTWSPTERVTRGSQVGKECLYDGNGEETGVRTTI